MLYLLSRPISPAFFPSLHILKITRGYYDNEYDPDYIEHLLLSIKAVGAPTLKTIILGEGRHIDSCELLGVSYHCNCIYSMK